MLKIFIIALTVLLLSYPTYAIEQTINRKVTLGGQLASGNTNSNSLHGDFYLNRNNKWTDELTLFGSIDQAATDYVQNMYKWNLTTRYAKSYQKSCYGFFRLELDHDRFKNISLRVTPTAGIGNWWSDGKDVKILTEAALGWQRETLLGNTISDTVLLQLRGYLSADIFDNAKFSENIDIYTDTANYNNYRIVSTSNLTNPLNKNLAFKFSVKDEYTNLPPQGIHRNDLTITLGLEYSVKQISKN